MSPLAPVASRGYPDGQRIQNWDLPSLYVNATVGASGGESSAILDVSRYGYLAGWDQVGNLPVHFTPTWFNDQAGTQDIGSFDWTYSPLITNPAQLRIPNLGPWVQLTWLPMTAGTWNHTVRMIATNRFHPLPFIPTQQVLIDQQNAAIASLATVTLYPTDFYAGPCSVFTNCANASSVIFETLTTSNVWDRFYQVNPAAATVNDFGVTMPPGSWRCRFINGAASATTFYCVVTPSLTGSS